MTPRPTTTRRKHPAFIHHQPTSNRQSTSDGARFQIIISILHPRARRSPCPLLAQQTTFMASEATPRVNAKYLDSFTNQTVRILGKVVSLRGETATIDASGSVNLHLNRVILPQTLSHTGWMNWGNTRAGCADGKRATQ